MVATDQQLTHLLEHCIGFAKEMIGKAGEFHPFGAQIGPLGAMTALGFWNGDENPPGAEAYAYAQDVMAAKVVNDGILAGAIAANVNIPPQFEAAFPDGIRVQIESADYARLIYLPYQIKRVGWLSKSTVTYAEMFAVDIAPAFFVAEAGR